MSKKVPIDIVEVRKTISEIADFVRAYWAAKEKPEKVPLGRLVSRLISQLQIKQNELAVALEVDPMTVSRWLRSINVPRLTQIQAFERIPSLVLEAQEAGLETGMVLHPAHPLLNLSLSSEDLEYLRKFAELTGKAVLVTDIPTLLRLKQGEKT